MEMVYVDGQVIVRELSEQNLALERETRALREENDDLRAQLAQQQAVRAALVATHADLQLAVREVAAQHCGHDQASDADVALRRRLRHQVRGVRS
jgi:hypothetical protein